MKHILLHAVALLLATAAAQARMNVVATTADLGALALEVGGEQINLTVLARPKEDPHFVEAKPSLMVKLNRAQVLIEGGAELEAGWLPPLVAGARNAKINPGAPGNVKANTGVTMLEVPTELDRSKGDIHAGGNPHFLVDPANALIVITNLAEAFAKQDPDAASAYRRNAALFADKLTSKLAEWQRKFEPCKGECVVAYHNSWPYFARRFGFQIDLFLEPKPGIPPSPAHLAEVIARMKSRKARVVIADIYLDERTAQMVAGRTGSRVVRVTQFPGGLPGTEGGYIEMLDCLVNSLARAFAAHQP
jgi:zinc/manganese transport system substrate-binding protein